MKRERVRQQKSDRQKERYLENKSQLSELHQFSCNCFHTQIQCFNYASWSSHQHMLQYMTLFPLQHEYQWQPKLTHFPLSVIFSNASRFALVKLSLWSVECTFFLRMCCFFRHIHSVSYTFGRLCWARVAVSQPLVQKNSSRQKPFFTFL